MSIHLTSDAINNMTDSEILALGLPTINIHTKEKVNKIISPYIYMYKTEHNYSLTTFNEADIIGKNELTVEEALMLVSSPNKNQCVGKLVTGITNNSYSGKYRIIGYDHDGSTNTFDLITEDCVAKMVFGSSNRHYNDSNCIVRKYVEDTFYNAFDSSVKKHIKPMEVKYYYNTGGGIYGTLQKNTAYCKLLSYNEIGYGIDGPSKANYVPYDKEGDLYPYFNNTTTSLRIKKYNGNDGWWLRSRGTLYTYSVGSISNDGSANIYGQYNSTLCVAPVLRIG